MKKKIGLSEMVVALRKELLEAQQLGEEQDLRFRVDGIEVELDVATTKKAGAQGGVKFWVYNASAKAELGEVSTQKLRLKLTPSTPEGDLKISQETSK